MTRKIAFIQLLILLLVSTAFSQNGSNNNFYRTLVQDVRAKAMGNTEILGVNGSSALFSNPALLSQLNQFQLKICGGSYFGWEYNQYMEKEHSGEHESFSSSFPIVARLNSTSVSYPFLFDGMINNLTLGFGFRYANHMVQDYESLTKSESSSIPGNIIEKEVKKYYKGGVRYFSPAVSIEFLEKISLGYTYHYGKNSNLSSESRTTEREYFLYGRVDVNKFGSKSEYNIDAEYQTLALSYFNETFMAGITYNTAYKFYYHDIKITSNIGSYQRDDYSRSYPYQIGISLGYYVLPNLLFVHEIQCRKLTDIAIDGIQSKNKDQFANRFGMEFSPTSGVFLRCGAFSDYYLIESYSYDSDNYQFYGITGGVGLVHHNFAIDFSAEFLMNYGKDQRYGGSWYDEYEDIEYEYLYMDFSLTYFIDFSD